VSPGAAGTSCSVSGNPKGTGQSEAQLLAGFANTVTNKLRYTLAGVANNSREEGLEKRKEKFISGTGSWGRWQLKP